MISRGWLSHPVFKVVFMQSAPSSGLVDAFVGASCGAAGSVCVGRVDEVGMSDEALRSHLKLLGRAESRLAAMRSRALAELSRRHSKGDAQRLVRSELQASKREAKRDVETAERLSELPATSDALESGEIPVGHARLIARASGESPIDEGLLVDAANSEPFDEFARTVKRHQQDIADDDGQALLDRQRSRRKARIFESSDSGMFVLSGEFDQITGARIATALTAKERQLWHRENPDNRATPQQRMADALAELICQPAGDGKPAGTDLLVIADFDVLKQQLDNPRLADGSPIPIVELHRLALEANLLPSIFDTKTQDMWLGRRLRTASEAQRVALIARDQHCIGCGANPLWCRAHHITWWSKNGPTNLDNLVLVCDDCHHKIHDHHWQVHQHPDTGKYQLKPPNPTDIAKGGGATKEPDTTRPTPRAQPSKEDKPADVVGTAKGGGATKEPDTTRPTPRPQPSQEDKPADATNTAKSGGATKEPDTTRPTPRPQPSQEDKPADATNTAKGGGATKEPDTTRPTPRAQPTREDKPADVVGTAKGGGATKEPDTTRPTPRPQPSQEDKPADVVGTAKPYNQKRRGNRTADGVKPTSTRPHTNANDDLDTSTRPQTNASDDLDTS